MHKIQAPGATQDNTFTEGDPSTGTPATEVSAAWLNAVQKELVTAIQAAGLTLKTAEDETGDQLLAAINKLIQDSNANSGYQFAAYDEDRTYTTGEIVRGSDGEFYEFYDRDQVGEVQGVDPIDSQNRPHIWMKWDGVRPGTTIEWRSETLPEGYVENDGSELSRADYRRIYAIFGDIYGAGDGSTTFGMPDDRGEFKRGLDRGRGVDPGRAIADHQLDQMQRITGELLGDNLFRGRNNITVSGALSKTTQRNNTNFDGSNNHSYVDIVFDSLDSPNSRASETTDGETRSRNNAVIYLTKA